MDPDSKNMLKRFAEFEKRKEQVVADNTKLKASVSSFRAKCQRAYGEQGKLLCSSIQNFEGLTHPSSFELGTPKLGRDYIRKHQQWWDCVRNLYADVTAYEERRRTKTRKQVYTAEDREMFSQQNEQLRQMDSVNTTLERESARLAQEVEEVETHMEDMCMSHTAELEAMKDSHKTKTDELLAEINRFLATGSPNVVQRHEKAVAKIQSCNSRKIDAMKKEIAEAMKQIEDVKERCGQKEKEVEDRSAKDRLPEGTDSDVEFMGDTIMDSQEPPANPSTSAAAAAVDRQRRKLFNPKENALVDVE